MYLPSEILPEPGGISALFILKYLRFCGSAFLRLRTYDWFIVAFALRLRCVCVVFALRVHCVCIAFALRFALCLRCVCVAFVLTFRLMFL